ncbi:Mevalonate kinase [Alteracholeplasma palmae J233]|uniref:Mevalonate kinase n=1 Tax=Alteracholeplasma palmae (strain ATCC 49389 / J233) TaxID=1318466 RepID=U4KL04_ALTPJ|nr:mevalonate kinase [Alteracholeplasma palmae]CCV64524.1 Mevalonate kinase [Alteracholeplasma palmae J233]
MNHLGYGFANGKIILMGEHSVVYGKPAIALPFKEVKIESYVSFTNSPITIDCLYYKGILEEADLVIEGIKKLVISVLEYLGKKPFGLHIRIDSKLPAQRGLGSSAAVSIAVVRSLFNLYNEILTDELLQYFSNIAEQIHHVNPSGIDSSTVVSNDAIFFQKDSEKTYIPLRVDGILVVADTGRMGKTKEAILEVKKLWKENPTIINPILDRLGELTNEVRSYLISNEVKRLGMALTEAHQLLKSINVSDEGLEKLVDAALASGALGAKLTGGGKGGCMIAVVESLEKAKAVAEALKENGASNTWFYHLKEVINES